MPQSCWRDDLGDRARQPLVDLGAPCLAQGRQDVQVGLPRQVAAVRGADPSRGLSDRQASHG
jgi:hypothetical protein